MQQATMGLFLLAMLVHAAPAGDSQAAAPPSTRFEAFVELCETSRRGAILLAQQRLRALKSKGETSSASATQVRRLEEELRLLKEGTQPIVPPLRFPPAIGSIGHVPKLSCYVEQVISAEEMLVRCYFTVRTVKVEHFRPRGESVVHPLTFLVRGVSTENAMEGADLELTQVFEITGNSTYRTADGGTNTAMTLAEFDMKLLEPYFKAARTRPR
jgi:hypothetical protein